MALIKLNTRSIPDDAVTPEKVSQNLGRRNLIINGAMQVAQRSSSVTGVTTNGYRTCDRMEVNINNLGTYTVTQENDAPEGLANSLKIDCTVADASPATSDYVFVAHKIEGQNVQHLKKGTADALPVTLSFWVKSNMTGTYQFNARDNDNVRYISASYTINAADTWEYKTLLIAGDTIGAFDNDANESLKVEWWLDSGSNFDSGTLNTSWTAANNINRNAASTVSIGGSTSNYWQITGVQLEVGDTATSFEHRSYGEEISLCQRYYFEPTDLQSTNRYCIWQGRTVNGSSYNSTFYLPVPMRGAPTYTVDIGQDDNFNATSVFVSNMSNQTGRVGATSNATSNNGYFYYTITADAEL